MHVLILGARAPAALEWARAFHATGWRVTAADSLAWPLTRASRAIDDYVRLPEPRTDTHAWIDSLRRLVVGRGIDLVLPICEEVFYLAYGREHLPCRVATVDFETLHTLHHKFRFAAMTANWPAAAPETRLLETPEAVTALTHEVENWVFKPAYSRFANRTLICPTPHALRAVCPTHAHPWVAQRFVAGLEHCSYSLLTDGRLTAHACYHPRYRVGRGSGIWFEPTDPAPIRAFLECFGAATGYSGQIAFDFIEDAGGHCHVLECNPRATSGVHLFDDQPEALVAALLGRNGVLTPTQTPRMVAFAMLLFGVPRGLFAPAFWRDYAAARDVVARPGDLGPLVAQIPGLLEIVGRALWLRRGILAAATADIEWDGQVIADAP